jgi:hypothetical protein
MKEADLFRRYAKEAMRWSSSKSANADEIVGTSQPRPQLCTSSLGGYVGVKLYSVVPSPNARGDSPCLLIFL